MYDTHEVLKDEIKTKEDDPFAQRHEKLGTEKMYAYLKTMILDQFL